MTKEDLKQNIHLASSYLTSTSGGNITNRFKTFLMKQCRCGHLQPWIIKKLINYNNKYLNLRKKLFVLM